MDKNKLIEYSPSGNDKVIKIQGLYFGIYRKREPYNIIVDRRVITPSFLQLWFKATENEWDDDLWEDLSDANQDFFTKAYHMSNQPFNKKLELAVAKKFKKCQQRLMLIEGMISSGNTNKDLLLEFNDIIKSLINSNQIPSKTGTRMIKRVERTLKQSF
jgi:hypothetical protein